MRKSELIDIYILEILNKYASPKKKMFQKELIDRLQNEYDVSVTRNTLARYLEELKNHDLIDGSRGYCAKNRFSDIELRLLIDGVLFGQHIPSKEAVELIEKIKDMSTLEVRNSIRNVHYVQNFNRNANKQMYQMLDIIDDAIQRKRQIRVFQGRYNTEKRFENQQKELIVDPYYLVTEKSRYYLICFVHAEGNSHHGKGLENLRVDRFFKVELLDKPQQPIQKTPEYQYQSFELDKYMKEHIYMWTGKSCPVTISLKAKNIGDFIDWFGTDFVIRSKKDGMLTVRITVNENAIKYWALQYGQMATILKPDYLRKDLKEMLSGILKQYED